MSFRAGTRPAPTGLDRARELFLFAATEALTDAGLWDGQSLQTVDPSRVGCTVSASKPSSTPRASRHASRGHQLMNVSNRFGLRGERRNVIAACATGACSIALGASWIEQAFATSCWPDRSSHTRIR